MIVHIKKRWGKAVLLLASGETIFLKQERGCVYQITACQCAVHPGNSHPSMIVFGGKTVKERVDEILTEHGERLTLIPIGINNQSMIIETNRKNPTKREPEIRTSDEQAGIPLTSRTRRVHAGT